MAFSCLVGLAGRVPGVTRHSAAPGRLRSRGRITLLGGPGSLPTAAGSAQMPEGTGSGGGRLPRPVVEGQAGQVGAATGAGLVPDPVQVRADGADADEERAGDLAVGQALGHERD
jgi:hypothetical protein